MCPPCLRSNELPVCLIPADGSYATISCGSVIPLPQQDCPDDRSREAIRVPLLHWQTDCATPRRCRPHFVRRLGAALSNAGPSSLSALSNWQHRLWLVPCGLSPQRNRVLLPVVDLIRKVAGTINCSVLINLSRIFNTFNHPICVNRIL